ncbi:uncharacterized protein LOC116196414 [Punica granatum]|uniref:Uncharacterized protein LOC116196414 n=2 Tax=Punica granatum TaxID=22663 RepID=A0A6P8CDG5_PUNGR|nr:uncharacterized protein LOC116196414 [Punica granatum]PKI50227.1 hypothetical protein CRG98_029300 [Punica granatum]
MEGLRGSRRVATAMAMMAVLVVVSTVSGVEWQDKIQWCSFACSLQCSFVPDQNVCLIQCLKNCGGGAALLGPLGHCNVGCIRSSCLDSHPDAEKMHSCISSCSNGCNEVYVSH